MINQPAPARKPDVIVAVFESLPSELTNDVVKEILDHGIDARSVRTSSGPFAGVELYLPSAIAVFLASSYFGGAFKKMGEDHYGVVKNAASALFRRGSGLRVWMTGSKGKVDGQQVYSLAFSITADLGQGYAARLLFPQGASIEDAEQAIAAFFQLAAEINSDVSDGTALRELIKFPPIGRIILTTLDPTSGKIVAIDPLGGRR